MFKKLLLLFCAVLCHLTVNAQQFVPKNTVYLKDGSFLKGTVLSENKEQLELQLADGSSLQLSKANIEKVQELDLNRLYFSAGQFIKSSGLYKVLTLGILVAEDPRFEEIKTGAHLLHFAMGHQFNPYFAIGGGLGIDNYDFGLIPFYLDLRGQVLKKAISPYYALNAGYAIAFSGDDESAEYRGGWMVNPSVGLRFATKEKVSFLFEVGYKMQKAQVSSERFGWIDKWTYRRISIKAGIQF